ncbi:hypothetical protein H0H93_006338 [Arthromyces matolae]|nr:hypothetical protein H0H93_006338 [Arthromyces matolae]
MNFKSFVLFGTSAFAFATQALGATYPFSSAGSVASASSGANVGSITEYLISGTFDVGTINVPGTATIAPPDEVGNFTSISAAVLSTEAVAFEEVAYNSPILAAYQSGGSSAFLEVTFVDAKNPGALSQVIKKNGTWSTTIYTLQG